jgi:hypothetical protein
MSIIEDPEEFFFLVLDTCEKCPESITCKTKEDFLNGENNLDNCQRIDQAIRKRNTVYGSVAIRMEYNLDDLVIDHIDIPDSDELKQFSGKTFRDLSTEELERVFEIEFYNLISEPSGLDFEVDVQVGERDEDEP